MRENVCQIGKNLHFCRRKNHLDEAFARSNFDKISEKVYHFRSLNKHEIQWIALENRDCVGR